MQTFFFPSRLRVRFVCGLPLLLVFLCSACGGSSRRERLTPEPVKPSDLSTEPSIEPDSLRPPWQLWLPEPTDTQLGATDALEAHGHLLEAEHRYRDIETASAPGRSREEAFSRRVGVLLKQGRSREALEQITDHLKAENVSTENISPILALMAAYSYIHLGDYDQALAWFGTVLRKSDRRSVVARRADEQVTVLVASISEANFPTASRTWASDQLFARVFEQEKQRRASGGKPDISAFARWFDAKSYGVQPNLGVRESDIGTAANPPPLPSPTGAVIGVLLPASGKYGEYAAKIRNGIELALKDSGHGEQIQLVFADSTADPLTAEAEYERLCREQGAAIVVGPLLAKVTEQIAKKSESVRVPFLSFTKRPGVTALSNVAFRLGATAENQTNELVEYASKQLSFKKFAMLSPLDGANGEEFSAAFRGSLSQLRGQLVGDASYTPKNAGSVAEAIAKISGSGAEAVFMSEGLETALPVIEALRNSPLRSAVILGPAVWNDSVAARGYGSLLEGSIIATPFFIGGEQPQVSGFVTRYRQAYGQEPELLGAQAYDAAMIIISGLVNTPVGTADFRDKFISNLKSVDNMEGVTGKLSVRRDGEISRRMSVLRLHNGELLEVMRGGTVTGFVPDDTNAQDSEKKT